MLSHDIGAFEKGKWLFEAFGEMIPKYYTVAAAAAKYLTIASEYVTVGGEKIDIQ